MGFLHLLEEVERNSTVYVSIPFLTHFCVLDQLCHFATPEHGDLKIHVILRPAECYVPHMEKFIGGDERIRKEFGKDGANGAPWIC